MSENADTSAPVETTLTKVLTDHDVVQVLDNDVIVVTPKTFADATPDIRELGSASPSPFTGWGRYEYNSRLRGREGLRVYDEMRRSDSSVRGSLTLSKTPVLGARWFVEPHSDSARDKNAAEHVWWNLSEGMSTSWPQFLSEALKMLDYGYYVFEKVFTLQHPQKPGMVCWKKFAPRHPLDIEDWDWDANGGPAAVIMQGTHGAAFIKIPIDKVLCFTYDKEGGDMTGTSLLRSAFKPWFMKQNMEKIDAIQKERHGIGVPIIKLPVGFSDRDKILAEQMGRNLRTNERAHIVLPPMWEIMFAKLEGQPVDTLRSVEYHDRMIWQNVLARFMANTNATIKDDDRILFLQATRFIAEIVQDVINKYAIPQLVDYNWSRVKGYPKLRARRIGEQADWRTFTFALRNMVGAGVVTPDDKLEEQVRDEMDLPAADPDTARNEPTPQGPPGKEANVPEPPAPPKVGPPRQAPPAAKPGTAGAGRDTSGGK